MPGPRTPRLAAALLCGLLGGCVTSRGSAPEPGGERVESGRPTFLQRTYMTMDARCRPVRRPTGLLIEPPRHGKVRLATREATAEYGPGPFRHCDGKVGPALAFEYTSRDGYRGPDGFRVRVRYQDGETRSVRLDVTVE